ncbi:ATP-binding protein [Kandleria vitulina]|uniref:ATP-binding protein n=1 Tax=Kandleria vitulina TaxID=1630 RepID=UPI0009442C64
MSTIITTNKTLSKWTEIFSNLIIANVILDRLLHLSYVINIIVSSFHSARNQHAFLLSGCNQ